MTLCKLSAHSKQYRGFITLDALAKMHNVARRAGTGPIIRPAESSRATFHFLESGMPHVILRFRLPAEQTELNAAMQGADAKAAIWQVDQYCRGILKHGEPSAETRRHLEEIRETLRERPGLLDD